MFRTLTLTGEQIRAARAMARVEQAELARRSGLSLETIKRLERIRGPVDANSRTLNAIGEAFLIMGIELYSDDGVGVRARNAAAAAPWRAPAPPPRDFHGQLQRVIYHSQLTLAGAELRELLDQLLRRGADANARLGVTGVVLVSHGQCLQVLEGEKSAVQQVFGAISADPRHRDLRVVESRLITARHFGDWTVSCGDFESDTELLKMEPVLDGGLHTEMLSPASALGVLGLAREMQHAAPRRARAAAVDCPLARDCRDPKCGTGGSPPPLQTAA